MNNYLDLINPITNYQTLATSSHSQIVFVITLLILWSQLYMFVNKSLVLKDLSIKDSNDVKNRVVSIFHGCLSFWFAFSQYYHGPTFNLPNTNFQSFICLFSLSYCIYDLLACLYYRLSDLSLILHHLFCIMGFGFGVIGGYGAIDGVGGLFAAEVSNFYMHARVILRIFNRKNTKAYELAENIYLATYIVFRGLLCPFIVWYPCVNSSNTPIVVKLMCSAIVLQSYYFIYQMASIIKKKIKRSKQLSEKKIELQWLSENPQDLQKLSFTKKQQKTTIF